MIKSTLVFSPRERNIGVIDATIRYLLGGVLLSLVVAYLIPEPEYIFGLSVMGFYAVMTALLRFEPAYWVSQITSVPAPSMENHRRTWIRFLSTSNAES